MSTFIRRAARYAAYLIAFLLAAVWMFGALGSFAQPLFDLGRPQVGDTIMWTAAAVALPPDAVLPFARLLVGLEFMVGAFLLAAAAGGVFEKIRFGSSDDALLDVALFVAAVASVLSAVPGLLHGGALLQGAIGELMLCAIAGSCAVYGRGYVVREELPRATRPAFGYGEVR